MATINKDVLYPGVWTLANGEQWECLPSYVRQAVVNGNNMIRAGNVSAPLIWEHDGNIGPQLITAMLSSMSQRDVRKYAANYSKETFGYANRYWLETVKGDPVAFAAVYVPDAADLSQFAKTRYISPRVMNGCTDPLGNRWQGAVIGHIAATPQPIQVIQRSVQLSQTAPSKTWVSVCLSYDTREEKAVADEKKDGDKKTEGGNNAGLERLKTALASLPNPITFPEGCASLDDMALVVEGLAANNAGGSGATGQDLDNDGLDDGTEGAVPAGMPAMLSQMTAAEKRPWEIIAGKERGSVIARVARIKKPALQGGHLTQKEFDAIEQHFKGMKDGVMLSIFGHGQKEPTPDRHLMQLENVERLLKIKRNTGAVDLSQSAVAVPIPERGHGDTRPSGAEAAQAATDYLIGIVSPTAAAKAAAAKK